MTRENSPLLGTQAVGLCAAESSSWRVLVCSCGLTDSEPSILGDIASIHALADLRISQPYYALARTGAGGEAMPPV